jgi:hypothetical protein
MTGESVRKPIRRIVMSAAVSMVIATVGLVGAEVASADWTDQYNATLDKSWLTCHRFANTEGHGDCYYVSYVASGDYPGAAGNRWFDWNIHFTNHTCPVEYHISADNRIFYADWNGPCY